MATKKSASVDRACRELKRATYHIQCVQECLFGGDGTPGYVLSDKLWDLVENLEEMREQLIMGMYQTPESDRKQANTDARTKRLAAEAGR